MIDTFLIDKIKDFRKRFLAEVFNFKGDILKVIQVVVFIVRIGGEVNAEL